MYVQRCQYDRFPGRFRSGRGGEAWNSEEEIRRTLLAALCKKGRVLTVECCPGVNVTDILTLFRDGDFSLILYSDALAVSPKTMDAMIEDDLTADPVFGHMTTRTFRLVSPEREEIRLIAARHIPFAELPDAADAEKRIVMTDAGFVTPYCEVTLEPVKLSDNGFAVTLGAYETQAFEIRY